MKHISSGPTRLLIRPEHVENESLRGYVSRVSSGNGSSPLVKPMLVTLRATTEAIHKLATLTGCSSALLIAHGSLAQIGRYRHSGVLFGSFTISTAKLRLSRRMVCPVCLLKNGISTCCWELRDYDVCHEHGCYLVSNCSGCDQQLSWLSTKADICSCGVRYADMQTELAPIDRKSICKFMGDAMLATTALANQKDVALKPLTPLVLFFAISFFVRSVLIPSFLSSHVRYKRQDADRTWDELYVAILKDREYYGHLCELILLHATRNPVTMAQLFWDGISANNIAESFFPGLNDVTFPGHLLKVKADAIKDIGVPTPISIFKEV